MGDSLVDRLLARDPRAIARALSTVADEAAGASALVSRIRVHRGRAFRLGVTGPPGAGKSTLVDRLIGEFRREGRTVGVLAVDPTSPFSGGAILGDRVRMQAHASDPGVFIRSMATRGHVGGLARTTEDAVTVLDAAGFDVVIIETVGVGQDEVDVVRLADLSIVVLVPGSGDDVQALKAGLMEIADIFVVNKADREGADRAVGSVEAVLSLDDAASDTWRPPVIRTVATDGSGIAELVAAIGRFRAVTAGMPRRHAVRRPGSGIVLDHVGVAVEDASTVLLFLEGLLGERAGPVEDVPSQQVRVRFLEAGAARVEVLESTGETSALAKFLRTRGPGLHHLAFRVDDLAAVMASLKSRGVRLVNDTPRPGARGTSIAFVHPSNTGGVLVELVEERATHADR